MSCIFRILIQGIPRVSPKEKFFEVVVFKEQKKVMKRPENCFTVFFAVSLPKKSVPRFILG
jgi:hypothetical protein